MAKSKSHGRKKVSDEKLKNATAYKNFPASITRYLPGMFLLNLCIGNAIVQENVDQLITGAVALCGYSIQSLHRFFADAYKKDAVAIDSLHFAAFCDD